MSIRTQFEQFITDHLAVIEPLSKECNLAAWDMETLGTEEASTKLETLSLQIAKLYSNKEEYTMLKNLDTDQIGEPLMQRQHKLLLSSYLSCQIDESLMKQIVALQVEIADAYNNHRAQLRGETVTDNSLDELLISSKDVLLRKEAWEASKTVGEAVVERLLDLVRLRNKAAQSLGFPNYYNMSLVLQEQDETALFQLLDQLKALSDPIWNNYLAKLKADLATQFETTIAQIRPWHHANRFFQATGPTAANLDRFFEGKNLEELTSKFFANIGLPVDDLLAKADLYDRAKKCQHAFCMDVDRKGDIRVLCNCKSNERWMDTMLHEFGHAVYDKFVPKEMPYLLRGPSHTLTTEAIALYMGKLTKDDDWLRIYAGVSAIEAADVAGVARQAVHENQLVFMRWCLVMTNFERALYRDPEQDLNSLWWDMVEKYQGVTRPEDRILADWAAKAHLANSPVYYHNYQIGEMASAQMATYVKTVVLAGEPPEAFVTNPKVGDYLRNEVFAPGATIAWEAWIQQTTGEPLNPEWFISQLGNA